MVRILAAIFVLAVALLISTSAAAAAGLAPQQPGVEAHIAVESDGADPFDADDTIGNDTDGANGRVRNFDLMKFRVEVALNGASDSNVVAVVTLNDKAKWGSVPSECLTVAGGFSVAPDSEIADNDGDGLEETLVCNLGSQQQGTKLLLFPLAQVIGSNNEIVSASLVGDSDNNTNRGNPTSGDKTADTIITAVFGVSINHTVNGLPDVDEINYEDTYVPASKFGREGQIVDWQIDLQYDVGSELVQNTNDTQTFTLELFWKGTHSNCTGIGPDCDLQGDNANGVFSDGVTLLSSVDSTATGCELLTPGGSLFCVQNQPGEAVVIPVLDVPVNRKTIASVKVRMFYPHDVLFTPNGFSAGETYFTESEARLTSWAGTGTLVTSVSGAVDPGPEAESADWLINASNSGPFSFYNSFDQFSVHKSGARAAAQGEVLATTMWIADYRPKDTQTGICNTIDTDSFEFVGSIWPGPGQQDSREHKGFWHREHNPVMLSWTAASNDKGYHRALDFGASVEFSDVDYGVTGDDHWSATCEDDLDGDGINDWVDDFNALPGGSSSVVRVRLTWDRNYTDLRQGIPPTHPNTYIGFSFDLRVQPTAPIGEYLPNVASVFFDDWGGWTQSSSGFMPNGRPDPSLYVNVPDDPTNPLFSFNDHHADRVLVVPASLSVEKKLSSTSGIGPFVGGEEVVFEIDTFTGGSNANSVEITLTDVLPNQLEYVSDDCETVFAPTQFECETTTNGQVITWAITNYKVGEPIPTISLSARIRAGAGTGTFVNSVTADSDFDALVSDDFCNSVPTRQAQCRLALARRISSQASVTTVGQAGFAIKKTDGGDTVDVGGQWVSDLVITNLGGSTVGVGQIIDVLPFNGDGDLAAAANNAHSSTHRHNTENLASQHDSTFTLDPLGRATFVDVTGSTGTEVFEYTTKESDLIDHRPCHPSNWAAGAALAGGDDILDAVCAGGLLDVATDKPSATVLGTGETTWSSTPPVTLSDVTGVRATFEHLGPGEEEDVTLTLAVGKGVPGNLFCNNFGANTTVSVFDVVSNDVCVEVSGRNFDAALTKRSTTTAVGAGETVKFEIEVFNQGDHEIADVVVRDQLPDGFSLADTAWFDNGNGVVSTVIAGPIAPGDSTVISLTANVSDLVSGKVTNVAEITEVKDSAGHVVYDVDSLADSDPTNDVTIDDAINGCGTCAIADEDDHDIAILEVTSKGTLALTGANLSVSIWLALALTAAGGAGISRRTKVGLR